MPELILLSNSFGPCPTIRTTNDIPIVRPA
jgi:hypothetical protein